MDDLPDAVAEGSDPGFLSSPFEHSLGLMDIWRVRRQFLGFRRPKLPDQGSPRWNRQRRLWMGSSPFPEEDPFPRPFLTSGKLFPPCSLSRLPDMSLMNRV